MNYSVAMENGSMGKKPVALGEMFHKAGRPRIIWAVERFNLGASITHVVLKKIDDPTTKITISANTLSDPLYFCRSITPPWIST